MMISSIAWLPKPPKKKGNIYLKKKIEKKNRKRDKKNTRSSMEVRA